MHQRPATVGGFWQIVITASDAIRGGCGAIPGQLEVFEGPISVDTLVMICMGDHER